jgi:predicted restriction endonuclease
VEVFPRLGQGSFRLIVTDSYDRRCAFTNSPVLHVLEAAHIRPYSAGGTHAPSNGILLRQDLHTLLDRGYMTVTPGHRIEVSSRIKEEFHNGKEYYALHGHESTSELKRSEMLPMFRQRNLPRMRWERQVPDRNASLFRQPFQTRHPLGWHCGWILGFGLPHQ